MRRCSCGRANPDDHDWCACGAYLAFDADAAIDGVAEGAAEAPAPAPDEDALATAVMDEPQRATAVLLVRGIDSHLYLNPDEPPLSVRVQAGGRAVVRALIRNQGLKVDAYEARIEGADPAWWTVTPPRVDLIPFGTREGYEDEVEIVLHPPRTPAAAAGVWDLLLVVRSRDTLQDVASVRLFMEIEPFHRLETSIRPQVRTGRRRARYASTLRNSGNTPVTVALSAADPEDACRYDFVTGRIPLDRGAAVDHQIVVRPRRQIWIGRPRDHRFELFGRVQEDPEIVASVAATYRQRPWVPWWMAIVVPLLALAAVALFLLLRDDEAKAARVEVPNLVGVPRRLLMQQMLESSGLKLNPVRQADRDRKPGVRTWTAIGQSPAPGEKVAAGSDVSVVVQGPPLVTVPRLRGKNAPDAEQALVGVRLKLGKVDPGPDPALRVVSQIPKAGTRRRPGTAVDLVLAKPKSKPKGGKEDEDGGGGGGGGGDGGGAGGKAQVKVPAFEDATLPAYRKVLAKAGLAPVAVRRISVRPRGAVLRTTPKPGTEVKRGAKVRVAVSAGFPRLAYDDGTSVVLARGASGAKPTRLAPGPPAMAEPTWTTDRRRIAYSAGRAIFIRNANGRSAPRQITPVGSPRTFTHPAFAPTAQRDVLAFVRRNAEVDELCLTAVRRLRARTPDCTAVPGWALDSIGWAPSGGMLLVGASPRGAAGPAGLLFFVTDTPFTIDADAWKRSGDSAEADVPGARLARFSADGRRLAVILGRPDGTFRLALTAADDLKLEQAKALRISACDVAWRSDGRELAIVQAGPTCPAGALGTIVRLDPAQPSRAVTVALTGLHPSWEPLRLQAG